MRGGVVPQSAAGGCSTAAASGLLGHGRWLGPCVVLRVVGVWVVGAVRSTPFPIGSAADRSGEKGHTMLRQGFVLVVAAMVAALTFAGSALGDKPVSVPVSFDLSAATCSQMPAGTVIHGEGTALFSGTSSGTFHAVINGTATDGAGNTWRFNYNQNGRPLGDGGEVQLIDQFNLVGNAGVLHLHSHFVGIFSSAGLVEFKQLTGDPFGCDPI